MSSIVTTPDEISVESHEPTASVSLAEAFRYWLKLGCISFGGPAGQIALMHADLVERERWISERRFLHALNYCMLLPGPEAMQLAVYIGWLMHRTVGGIMAGALFVLPSLLVFIVLSWLYVSFGDVPVVAGILFGIKPAIVAIVLSAAWRMGSHTLKNRWLIGIAVLAFISISVAQLPFPLIIGVAALIGFIGGRVMPDFFQPGGGHPSSRVTFGPALIDDDTPLPAHAAFSRRKLLLTSAIGIVIAVTGMALLYLLLGEKNLLSQMAWFFTKAALLTFGGAYAVLPYVYQGAVTTFQWLTPDQMMDGLALGETTPGPLIMIVAFVGFIGGWTKEIFANFSLFGPIALFASGAAGALVATFFTFLPSFIFILAGGPLIEATRDNIRLTAPLTAISAAVVGVITNLAVFFADQVFHISQPLSQWDSASIAIGLAAAIALMRYRVSATRVIVACAVAGLVVSYVPWW